MRRCYNRLFQTTLLCLLVLPLARAQAVAGERHIVADYSHPLGPHSKTPLNTVGAGRANEGLRADWQAQLATVQREIGFNYLRFHGLLGDDMAVYDEDAAGKPEYDFQYVDALYDALLEHHIKPFVELSFMPGKLASGTKTVFWWKANVTPPKDMAKWQGLVEALLRHWQERYGRAEVESWYYEVWNEPDYPAFFSGTFSDYLPLYKATAEAVKNVCPACRVGGPATAGGREKEFLDYVAASHSPVDFLSTHTYANTRGYMAETKTSGTVFNAKPDAILSRVRSSHAAIAASAYPGLPLHYTEWSSSSHSNDFFHDQYHSASFILDRLRQTSGLAESMSYWVFTDIFEENGPHHAAFYGGFGLMNEEGIRKPAFFAYKFLAELGPEDLETTDDGVRPADLPAPDHLLPQSWITRKASGPAAGSVQALFWSYNPISPGPNSIDQVFYKKELPAKPASPTSLTLTHLPNVRYRVEVYRTGYQQNDAYTAYVRMGEPSNLTKAQTAALNQVASGAPVETRTIQVKDGRFNERFSVRENDTVLLLLTAVKK